MDLLKQLTGKNPAEYEYAAQILVGTPDIELFEKLVKQDDFLFDFVKNNVAQRIQKAVTKDNYLNLFEFLNFYSPSYDSAIAESLLNFGGDDVIGKAKALLKDGSSSQKAYAAKILSLLSDKEISDMIDLIRIYAYSDNEYLSSNCIELLSRLNDEESKNKAIEELHSNDEFKAYDAVKFLVTFGAKDSLDEIINLMKKTSLSENIACEIPYLVPIEELLKNNHEDGILVLCNIISAIPEIAQPSIVLDYNFLELFEEFYNSNLTPQSALLLRIAKDKFYSLTENEEYLYDCDKNTKDEIANINKFFRSVNNSKLESLLYEELYDESDFVFFAVDYADSKEELETLLDSSNPTLILKVLGILKNKQMLNDSHKALALNSIANPELRQIVEVL